MRFQKMIKLKEENSKIFFNHQKININLKLKKGIYYNLFNEEKGKNRLDNLI